MNIKEMVKDNKKVRFKYFRENTFYYETECGFEFPIGIDEVNGATFQSEDRAMLFMRWIRKHLALIEKARADGAT